ncbi:DNA helicase UvrD [Candidatus Microgenomates bacterium]|nr:DNA helicase UvrD [Candidatus Microgenomates bacterium]
MKVVTDLHSHSRYARAVSQQMVLPVISEWAARKGIDVVSTGDWTHPLWLREIQAQLEEVAPGLYAVRAGDTGGRGPDTRADFNVEHWREGKPGAGPAFPLFLLSTEVAAIYSQGGKGRRIHMLIFAPSLTAVEKINKELTRRGANLFSDGRPILGMSARDVTQIVLEADERCLVIPAHAWTPWFSLYGSMSGFDSIEECFGDMAKFVYGIETGLSSDPAMNWRVADLDNRAILSFSDAHSPAKLGREATVFDLPEVSYNSIYDAIRLSGNWDTGTLGKNNPSNQDTQKPSNPKIAYTIEFYPEEGKYHFTGHRDCNVRQTPEETKELGTTCPVCKRLLTVGVMHRVEELAKRQNSRRARGPQGPEAKLKTKNDEHGVRWIQHQQNNRPSYVMIVPLLEILSEAIGSLTTSQRVINEYKKLTELLGSEFFVLLQTKSEEIERVSGGKIREALEKVRSGNIVIEPGYDGVFGKVKIWREETQRAKGKMQSIEEENKESQMGLF